MGQAKVNKEIGDANLTSEKTFSQLFTLPGLKEVESRLQELSTGFDAYTPLLPNLSPAVAKITSIAGIIMQFLASAPTEVLIDVACAVELIHAASLVHDDIVDHATL